MNSEAIKKAAQDYRPAMAKFLRDMIAIPSESCQEEGVVRRIAQEMESLGYDKVEFDKLECGSLAVVCSTCIVIWAD